MMARLTGGYVLRAWRMRGDRMGVCYPYQPTERGRAEKHFNELITAAEWDHIQLILCTEHVQMTYPPVPEAEEVPAFDLP